MLGSLLKGQVFAFRRLDAAAKKAARALSVDKTKRLITRQLLVAAGMAGACFVLIVIWQQGLMRVFSSAPPADDLLSRFAFAIRWLLVPGFCLAIGIGAVANRRFFSADAMDGTRTPESRSLEINLHYNQNTLEQVVLAAIAWLGLAIALPHDQLPVIAGLAILFAAGRALFWIGYLIAPWARAFGFGLTFYPTAVAYVWLVLRMLSSGA